MIALIGAALIIGLFIILGLLDVSGFFRALPLILLLSAIGLVAYFVIRVNVDPAWALSAGIAAPTSLLLWAAWRPGSSRRKLWIMDRALQTLSSLKWLSAIVFALSLPAVSFRLDVWLAEAWPWAVLGLISWLLQEWLNRFVVRSLAKEPGGFDRLRSL